MKRALLRNHSLYTCNLLSPPTFKPNPSPSSPTLSLASTRSKLRFYSSSENDSSNKNPKPLPDTNSTQPHMKDVSVDVAEVGNKELKMLIEKYSEGDEEAFPLIFEAILKRKLAGMTGKHEETVDEKLMEDLRHKPLDDDKDEEFESDFEELCDARDSDEENSE